MDGQEKVLVGRGAKDVGYCPELPGPKGRRLKEAGKDNLQSDDAEDNVFGEGLGATQLGDLEDSLATRARADGVERGQMNLWMGLDDGQSASAVRLFGVSPEEVMLGIGALRF